MKFDLEEKIRHPQLGDMVIFKTKHLEAHHLIIENKGFQFLCLETNCIISDSFNHKQDLIDSLKEVSDEYTIKVIPRERLKISLSDD